MIDLKGMRPGHWGKTGSRSFRGFMRMGIALRIIPQRYQIHVRRTRALELLKHFIYPSIPFLTNHSAI